MLKTTKIILPLILVAFIGIALLFFLKENNPPTYEKGTPTQLIAVAAPRKITIWYLNEEQDGLDTMIWQQEKRDFPNIVAAWIACNHLSDTVKLNSFTFSDNSITTEEKISGSNSTMMRNQQATELYLTTDFSSGFSTALEELPRTLLLQSLTQTLESYYFYAHLNHTLTVDGEQVQQASGSAERSE